MPSLMQATAPVPGFSPSTTQASHLDGAVAGGEAGAGAGVELGLVLHHPDGFAHGIQRRPAALEDQRPRRCGELAPNPGLHEAPICILARSPMDDDRRRRHRAPL